MCIANKSHVYNYYFIAPRFECKSWTCLGDFFLLSSAFIFSFHRPSRFIVSFARRMLCVPGSCIRFVLRFMYSINFTPYFNAISDNLFSFKRSLSKTSKRCETLLSYLCQDFFFIIFVSLNWNMYLYVS